MTPLESCPWSGFEPAAISFCERRLCHWIVEPANTWSNIGFILVGVLILLQQSAQVRTELRLIGIVSILVGIGSTMFHATGIRIGEIVDVSAMYLISALFLTFALKRYFGLVKRTLVAIYFAVASASILTLLLTRTDGIKLFALQITICSLLEIQMIRKRQYRTNYFFLKGLAGAFAFSFLMWFLDARQIVCDPDNHILGGHAIWHLANAVSLWCYFSFQEQFPA